MRMSALPVLQFCGGSRKLEDGAARAAAMSTAFHALCARKPEGRRLFDALTREEQAEVAGWARPSDLRVLEFELPYDEALTEFTVGLTKELRPAGFGDEVAIPGHPDMGWEIYDQHGRHWVVIGDIKKTRWTSSEGADSLQLHGYGIAYARERGADGYILAIWVATEARWEIRRAPVLLGSEDHLMAENRIRNAMANWESGEFNEGSHCDDHCYARLRCPMRMVRLDGRDVIPGTSQEQLDDEAARDLLKRYQKTKKTLEGLYKQLQAYADLYGGIPDETGERVWAAGIVQGPEKSLSPAKLREELGESAEALIKRSAPYLRYTWRKAT